MIYQCTKDILKALKVDTSDKPDIYNELFAWNVKLMKVRRRNFVYMMNDVSKLSVILYGMTAKEFKAFDDHVKDGVRKVLKDCGVADKTIEQYLEEAGEAIVTSSGTRKQLGVLNRSAMEAEDLVDVLAEEGFLQRKLCEQQNSMIVKNDNGGYVTPKDLVKTLMKKTYGQNTVSYDLGEIALHMFMGDSMGIVAFLNIRDGSICVVEESSDEYEEMEYNEDYEMIPPERFDFFYYFNRFLRGVDHKKFQEELDRVKQGRGIIRRIKDLLCQYPEIQKKWYDYEEKAQEEAVKEWLESMGLM